MNDLITIQCCDKNMVSDFSCELSMPDYESEIRRLLRVCVTVTPPTPEISSGRVGMSGELVFNILYSGSDGMLYTTSTRCSYQMSEALTQKECGDISVLLCDAVPESLVSRVAAPRKLTLRCRLRGRAKGFANEDTGERLTYIEDPQSIQRLKKEQECTLLGSVSVSEFDISEDIPTENGGDIRIIGSEAWVCAEDCECIRDSCLINGAVYLSILAVKEDGESEPFKISKRIPFSEVVDADGATPDSSACARLALKDCSLSLEDGRISCELSLSSSVSYFENRTVEYTSDLYSTAVCSETTKKHIETPSKCRRFSGNFTASLHEPIDKYSLEENAVILDASVTALTKSIEREGEKWVLSGEADIWMLTKLDGDYAVKNAALPFRYELESGGEDMLLHSFTVTPISLKAKSENGKLSLYCELHAQGSLCKKAEFDSVDEGIFGDAVERDDSLTVCFPSPTDSTWDIAKKYHVTEEEITTKNPQKSNFVIV